MRKAKPQPALNPTIVWMTLAKLRTLENPSNSKKHDIPGIVTSIREFGFVAPPILDVRTGMISAGHGRAEALEKMRAAGEPPPRPVRVAGNEWELPVVTGTFFSKDDQHAGAYLVADNQLTIAGGFDDELTAKLLKDLPLDLRVTTGFTEAEVDRMLKALNIDNDSSNDKLDEAPEPPKNPVSKRGDVWKLGQHLLYCGSCTKLATVFGKKQWRLMVTDPPFGVDYEQVTATKKNQRKVPLAIEGDVGTPKQMDERWREWFGAMQKLVMPGACFYICSLPGHLCRWLMNAIEAVKLPYRHQLVWAKQQLVLGRGDYHYQHEPILYGWVEGAAHYAVKDRTETTVWKIDRPRSSELHPTMKPVELYLRAFRNSSDSGDLCCEPFAGSGTAFVAGEKAGRIIYGAEIDLRYCDVVVERWQQVADKKATRRAT